MTAIEKANEMSLLIVARMMACAIQDVPQEIKDKVGRLNALIRKAKPYDDNGEDWDIAHLRSTQALAGIVDEYQEKEYNTPKLTVEGNFVYETFRGQKKKVGQDPQETINGKFLYSKYL